MASKANKNGKNKERAKTSLALVDGLETNPNCTIADYVAAASEYVRSHRSLNKGQKKSAQIRLSDGLSRALRTDLAAKIPEIADAHAGERPVSGALRIVKADLSQSHALDGLRLAVELKPVNLAVGRAIWNRFGDIRTFAVNLHLKFPFSVVGGVLAIPTFEEKIKKKSGKIVDAVADDTDSAGESGADSSEENVVGSSDDETEEQVVSVEAGDEIIQVSTVHLIERAIKRLIRAGGRRSEGDAPHLLEGISVVVYDPNTGQISPDIPHKGSKLRWEEFVEDIATAYEARFEIEPR